jgi:methionyl-tRNA synthetase
MLDRYQDGQVAEGETDPELAADFEGLGERVAELLDDADLTAALDEVWKRVRRLNRYVEERAPWKLAKEAGAEERLAVTLRSLAEGLRVVTVLLHPFLPRSSDILLAALGRPELDLEGARYGARVGGQRVQPIEALFPKR